MGTSFRTNHTISRPDLWLLVAVMAAGPLPFGPPAASAQLSVMLPAEAGDDTLPEPLVPRVPRDEADGDRLHASTLFTEGRLLFRREQFERALARYQRAYRYANGSTTILDEIVPLAYRLGRQDEAVRYAQWLTPQSKIDPFVLRRLALYLTEQEEFAAALRLYELTFQGPPEDEELGVPSVITHFEMGRLLYLTDRFAEGVVHFDEVRKVLMQADPTPAEQTGIDALVAERQVTYALMAETYLKAERPDPAAELFRMAYHAEPEAAILDFHLARCAAARKDRPQALELLRRYLRSGDSAAGTAPYELLLELLDPPQQADQALAELEQLVKQQPDNVFLVFFLGQQYLERRQAEAATGHFERLMQIRPLIDGYRGLIRAGIQQQDVAAVIRLLADVNTQLGSLEPVGDALEELVAAKPFFGNVVEAARKDALATASTLPEPTQRGIALALAELLVYADDLPAADPFYRRAAGQGETADPAVWLAWGMHRLAGPQPEQAIEVFQGILELAKEPAQQGPLHFYLAAALALDERYDEALAAARKAAELLPDIPAIQLRPAWILFLAQRWPEAAEAYRTVIERYGDEFDVPGLRATVREAKTSLSSVCVFLDRNEEAAEWLEQVLDEFPEDAGAHNDLGYLWADQGIHLQRALRMTRQATQWEPDNVAYRDSYGWALFRLGHYDQAVEQLRQAAAGDDPDGVILDHLGDALQQTEGPAAALATWQLALEKLGQTESQRRAQIEKKIQQVSAK